MSFDIYLISVPSPRNPDPPAPPPKETLIVVVFNKIIGLFRSNPSSSSSEPIMTKKVEPLTPLPPRSQMPNNSNGNQKPAANHPVSPSSQVISPQTLQPHASHNPSQHSNSGPEPNAKNSDSPPVEVEPQQEDVEVIPEPEAGKKAMEEVARDLAKKLIPEKFNFLIQTVFLFRAPHQNPVAKAEKPQAEEQQQKAPSSKSQSVAKGEAKTLQSGEVPEELEPAEKVGKEMFHNSVGKLPTKEADQQLPTALPWTKVEVKSDSKQWLEKFVDLVPQKSIEQVPAPKSTPLPSQQQPAEATSALMPMAATAQTTPQPHSPLPNQSPSNATPLPQSAVVPVGQSEQHIQSNPVIQPYMAVPNDPARLLSKGQAHIGKIPDLHAQGRDRPRQDAIVPRDKNEQAQAHAPRQLIDEKNIPRFPILPDFALSKEGILKELGHGGEAFLRDNEGYKLEDLILMLLCGVICGARKVDEVYRYLQAREAFFTAWMGLKNGLPSYRLLAIVMLRLNPSCLNDIYLAALGKKSLPVKGVRLWESDRGVIMGVLKQEPAVQLQEGFVPFDLKHAIITAESQSLDPSLSRLIHSKDADYVIPIRSKHGAAYANAQEFFGTTFLEQNSKHEISHHVLHEGSRVIQREVLVTDRVAWLPNHEVWTALRSTIRLKAEIVDGSKISTESRVFVSSLPAEVQGIASALRTHSAIESRVEWFLDFDFTRGGVDHIMENFDALRKISWEMLNCEKSQKATPEAKRKKALVDNAYLRKLLQVA